MDLLVLAHSGEAQSFIKNDDYKLIDEKMGLYSHPNNDSLICITGEGDIKVTPKIPYLLAKYQIKRVLNFGIAGSLKSTIKQDDIISIRTIYNHNGSDMSFHSFNTDDINAKFDCITASQRILEDEQAKYLRAFGDIVDRELWHLAKCLKPFGIKLYSFKLISDMAGDSTDCFDLALRAEYFSNKLYEFYKTSNTNITKQEKKQNLDLANIPASFTQKKQLIKLLSKLQINSDEEFQKYITDNNIKIQSKKDINNLVEYLQVEINPKLKSIHDRFGQQFSKIKNSGASIKLDPKLESSDFQLSMKINSKENIENLANALLEFDHNEYMKIWDGDV